MTHNLQRNLVSQTGVWPDGVTECLHDPHAPRAQFWHFKISVQSELPILLDDFEGWVPPRSLQKVWCCCSEVPHCSEEHLNSALNVRPCTLGTPLLCSWRPIGRMLLSDMLMCSMCVKVLNCPFTCLHFYWICWMQIRLTGALNLVFEYSGHI